MTTKQIATHSWKRGPLDHSPGEANQAALCSLGGDNSKPARFVRYKNECKIDHI